MANMSARPAESWRWQTQAFELSRRGPGGPGRSRRLVVRCPLREAAAFGAGAHRDELVRRVAPTLTERLGALRPPARSELADFFHILGTALSSGQPMLASLSMCARQARSATVRGCIGALAQLVSRGNEFHEAMARFPRMFSPVQVALARAASESSLEQAGALFVRMAEGLQRDSRLGRKFLGAIAYPAVLLCMSLAAALVLELKALPPMVELFRSMGATLPPVTRAFYGLSCFLGDNAAWLLPSLLAGLVLLALKLPLLLSLPAVERLGVRLWIIGPVILARALSRALSTFLLLKQAGAANREIFTLSAAASGNAAVAEFFEAAYRRVRAGESLEDAFLAERDLLGEEGIRLAGRIEAGMEGADIVPLLDSGIRELDDRAEARTALLPRLLELPMLGLCGLVIGLILLAMFLPYPSLLGDVARQMRGG